MKLNKLYQYKTTPISAKEAIVAGEKYRFTILTSRLIRIEYSETGYFEDRATQTVINREFDVPKFDVQESNGILTIITELIELTYDMEKPFMYTSLQVCYTGKNSGVLAGGISTVWR